MPPNLKEDTLIDVNEDGGFDSTLARQATTGDKAKSSRTAFGTSPKTTFLRRSSNGPDGEAVAVRANVNDIREHLKHLGPSNLASRPKSTRYSTVKIKQAPDSRRQSRAENPEDQDLIHEEERLPAPQGGEGEGLLRSAGHDAKDGVFAVKQGYGTLDFQKGDRTPGSRSQSQGLHSGPSSDTLGSINSAEGSPTSRKRQARSGSITENVVEAGGFRKMVLETSSSKDGDEFRGENNVVPKDNDSRVSISANANGGMASEAANDSTSTRQPLGEQVQKKKKNKNKKKK